MTWVQRVQAAGVLGATCAALALAGSATFGAAPQALGAFLALVAAVKAIAIAFGLFGYVAGRLVPRPEDA